MKIIEQTIGSFIDTICELYADNEAIVFPSVNSRYTYREFKKLYTRIAKGLVALGIKKGDHVAIWSLNSPEYIALQVATAKIGATLVCINSEYKEMEIEYALNFSESTTLFLSNGHGKLNYMDILSSICPELNTSKPGELHSSKLPKLKNVISLDNIDNENLFTFEKLLDMGETISNSEMEVLSKDIKSTDCVNIQYTSGTTGNPKAVMSSHFTILNNALVAGENFNYSSSEKLLTCLPLFHVMGLVLSVMVTLINGATIVLLERFSTTKALSAIQKEKCTAINGVPSMFKFLLKHPELTEGAVATLNKGMIAGSALSFDLTHNIMNRLNIKELSNVYGQTEGLGIAINKLTPDNFKAIQKNLGMPFNGAELKVINPLTGEELPAGKEGELCAKSPHLMQGYYKNEEATQKTIDKNGWLHTGDLAVKDSNGEYQLLGRIKEIIIRGGENISPIETEEILSKLDYVKDASIVGVPDKDLDEEVCAFIILEDGLTISKDTIRTYLTANLARFKIPKYIEFVHEFPCTSSGKVKKFELTNYAIKKLELNL